MIEANFIALGPFSFVFHRHRRASLFFASNQDAFDAGKDRHRRLSKFFASEEFLMESPAVAAHPLRLPSTFFLFPDEVRGEEGETEEVG